MLTLLNRYEVMILANGECQEIARSTTSSTVHC